MSTGQSDDEMDDADEMDDDEIPKARPKVKPLSKKSKEKAARDAEKAKDRKEQTANPYVETPYVGETLHPKPTKQPKFDKIGINELTDKNAVMDSNTGKTYWSLKNVSYIKDQVLLRGHKFTEGQKLNKTILKNTLLNDL